ncbi:hypothetical protein D1007_28624 [Hordeum vulgare]|nr:hypothetical protein D1007_28624 [Hordeum vulgare]
MWPPPNEKACELGTKYVDLEKEKNHLRLDLEVTMNDLNLLKKALEDKDKVLAKAKEKFEAVEKKLTAASKLEEENAKLKKESTDRHTKVEQMTKRRNCLENYLGDFANMMLGMLTGNFLS